MKKVIKHPDGRTETVEGTAEEIAEYERKLREGGKSKGGGRKPILHGAPEVDGKPLTDEEVTLIRLSRAGLVGKERKEPAFQPFTPITPVIWPTAPDPYWLRQDMPCSFCGQLKCNHLHVWCGDRPVSTTITLTSDNTGANSTLLQAAVDSALASFQRINDGWTPEIKVPTS